jgi:hypothetical protein
LSPADFYKTEEAANGLLKDENENLSRLESKFLEVVSYEANEVLMELAILRVSILV